MRKSLIGICVSMPLALVAVACGDDDASDPANEGGTSSAGTTSGGKSAGGSASAGKANGGSEAGGKANGGSSSGGKTSAGSGNAGEPGTAGEPGNEGGEGGAGGVGPTEPSIANAVYTMSNAADANQVLGFVRAGNGALTPMAAAFPTLGKGSGAGLGNQGALAYDLSKNRLYVVNAGDNSFSVFSVKEDGSLAVAKNITTAGFGDGAASLLGPKSITFHGDVVYVLYQGDATTASKIAGFKIAEAAGGALTGTAIANSELALSSATQSVDPAQIAFSPDGGWLVVTEKQSGAAGAVAGNGSIDTFSVAASGVATKKDFYPTAPAVGGGFQKTPFGFDFFGKFLIVSEAGATGTGSYTYANGVVTPVAGAQFLPTDPAPCWVSIVGNFAYVANAMGPNISGFTLSAQGALANIGPIENGIVASTGKTIPGATPTFQGPTDEIISHDGKFLYAINSKVPSIGVFGIEENGTLSRVGATDYTPPQPAQLPVGSTGLAAR